jgi:hypothetical protein
MGIAKGSRRPDPDVRHRAINGRQVWVHKRTHKRGVQPSAILDATEGNCNICQRTCRCEQRATGVRRLFFYSRTARVLIKPK